MRLVIHEISLNKYELAINQGLTVTFTDLVALLGLILGLVGTLISGINYYNSTVRGHLHVMIGKYLDPVSQEGNSDWLVYNVTNMGNLPFFVAGMGGKYMNGKLFIAINIVTTQNLPFKLEPRQMWSGGIDPKHILEIAEFWVWDSTGKYFKVKGKKAKKLVKELADQL